MATVSGTAQVPWWKEPTKDQWYAWVAAWLGWTLDAFDFTVFLLIIKPISETFHVSIPTVTFVFTITLWARLLGATASGWLGDRIGRKAPLMISILGYSACNFAAGLAPTFLFLFLARALLGVFMGAEWPAGAALAMESWPTRSRGFMSGVLQGSWGIGFLLSYAIYGLFYNSIGWRGMLLVGVLPALSVLYVRLLDDARRRDDRALQPVRRDAAEIVHVAVIGADQIDLDRRVGMADAGGPGRGNEEMPVGALDIHVVYPVRGIVVLHAGGGAQPAAPDAAVARTLARLCFAERALIDLLVEAVERAGAAAFFARLDRYLEGRQLRQARAEGRIDIFVEHLGAGVDVGVDIVDAKAVLHAGCSRFIMAANVAPGPEPSPEHPR